VRQAVADAALQDPWLERNQPRVSFYGFRSQGHALKADLPALRALAGCHRDLAGQDPAQYTATCTTDLRAFTAYGTGQATCFGPVAENIHAANERVRVDSVLHTARAYALFLARWCGLVE
jgi:acetylornithine deacetylase